MAPSDLPSNPLPSYWLDKIELGVDDQRPFPTTCDVVIVGAGLSGTSAAYHLAKIRPGLKIALCDARGISGGATGRNGGLLVPGLHDTWTSTVDKVGLDNARALLAFDRANVDAIKAFLKHHLSSSSLDPYMHEFADGCASTVDTDEELEFWKGEVEKLREAGFADYATIWSREETASRTRSTKWAGAFVTKPAFRIWPARLVLLIAQVAHSLGVSIHTNTPVTAVTKATVQVSGERSYCLTVHTGRGPLHTKKVIYCTNAHTQSLLPQLPIAPVRNQVIVTTPLPKDAIPFDMCISANDGYEYLSTREDGRIILGGMRHVVPGLEVGNGNDGTLDPVVSRALRSYLQETFPTLTGKFEIEAEWAGIMGFSADRLPFVGPLPQRSGEFVSAGFSGHGMPRTFLSGRAVAEMVARDGPDGVGEWFPRCLLPQGRVLESDDGSVIRVRPEKFQSKM
ncbi:FAD dependent oxidoreductase [Gaertneriomyces semiglobifer]|nr:FAD dependent oxidoreductase [Gaertneriomyces semiglobifer]